VAKEKELEMAHVLAQQVKDSIEKDKKQVEEQFEKLKAVESENAKVAEEYQKKKQELLAKEVRNK
jgi:formylmethanofuran dehydrogenase subunit A